MKILDRLLRASAIAGHRFGVYGWWQRLRRGDPSVYEKLPTLGTVEDIEEVVTDKAGVVWTRDRPSVMWDLVSHPGRWWARFLQTREGGMWVPPSVRAGGSGEVFETDEGEPLVTDNNDCDEAATCMIALLDLLRRSGKLGARALGSHPPVLLQVVWRDEFGEMRGHHVCAYPKRISREGPMHWFHGGNWGVYGPVSVDRPGDPLGTGALATLAKRVAGRKGTIIHAHACMKPETLSRWVLVV